MTDACPVCDAAAYDRSSGCPECGHYDEDLARAERRHRKQWDRRIEEEYYHG